MDASAVFGLLRRRGIALLLCLLAGLGGAAAITKSTPKAYRATTTVIITLPGTQSAQEALQGVQLTTQLLQSYAEVATSRQAAQQIKDKLSLPDTADAIRGKIAAVPQANTLLMSVSATDHVPARAQAIANAAADVLVLDVADLQQGRTDAVQARVLDAAEVPGSAVSPKPLRNLLLGVLLGILVGIGLGLALDALDRSVKTPLQAAEVFSAPLLGMIPKAKSNKITPDAVVDDPTGAPAEAYKALRTAVRFINPDKPLRTILVTSTASGEGKTTTATNLAIALAQGGQRVVLIDADLRRPRVAALMDLPEGAGLTSIVARQASLGDVILGWRDIVAVLGAGAVPPNPSEILGSQAVADTMAQLLANAEILVIDAPPVLPVTDAVVLATQVDGVIMVARAGRTKRTLAVEATRRLDAVGARLVGCVLNGVSTSAFQGYYDAYRYLARRPARGRFGRRSSDMVA